MSRVRQGHEAGRRHGRALRRTAGPGRVPGSAGDWARTPAAGEWTPPGAAGQRRERSTRPAERRGRPGHPLTPGGWRPGPISRRPSTGGNAGDDLSPRPPGRGEADAGGMAWGLRPSRQSPPRAHQEPDHEDQETYRGLTPPWGVRPFGICSGGAGQGPTSYKGYYVNSRLLAEVLCSQQVTSRNEVSERVLVSLKRREAKEKEGCSRGRRPLRGDPGCGVSLTISGGSCENRRAGCAAG